MQTYINIHFEFGTTDTDKNKTFEHVIKLGWSLSQTSYRMSARGDSNAFKDISGYVFFWDKETEPAFPDDSKIIYGVSTY